MGGAGKKLYRDFFSCNPGEPIHELWKHMHDDHTRIAWKGKPEEECPDAPRYKACGNSMCVNVMAWLGHRIDAVEKEISPTPG